MGLVDDEGERVPAVLVADGVEDVRKLLHRGDDDPLAVLEQGAEMARVLGMSHDGADLRELLDGVLDLLVQHPPIRHHDHRIDDRLTVPLQPDQLVGQPGDGVGLAAAGRVLNQILVADAPPRRVVQQLPHHVELVVARPDLLPLLLSRLRVPRLHDLGVVFDDVDEPAAGEDLFPEVVGLESVGIGRVARAVVPAAVEGQEP